MTVKELLSKQTDIEALFKKYEEIYPMLEDYEKEALGPQKVEYANELHYKLFCGFMERVMATDTTSSSKILFVTWRHSILVDDGDVIGLDSWMCDRESILKTAGEKEFGLWNEQGPRIEHYAYEMSPLDEILSAEVFLYGISEMNAVCEIINEITFFGIEEDKRMSRIEKVQEDLKKQLENIKDGEEGIPAEDVFRELEQEIYDKASDEVKLQILKEREEKKKHEKRDHLYSSVVLRSNHLQHIMAIMEYYRMELLSGRYNPDQKDTATNQSEAQ